MRADEAQRVVHGALRDELHVLGRTDVLAEVDLTELVAVRVDLKGRGAAREVGLVLGRRTGDLPRQKAVRQRDDLVALGAVAVVSSERQHRRVLTRRVVGERETLRDVVLNVLRGKRPADSVRARSAEPARVVASDVAREHDVAKHHDVLGLGNHRLGVARVVALDGLDARVGRDLHVGRAEQRGTGVTTRHRHDGRHRHVLDERARNHDLDRKPYAGIDALDDRPCSSQIVGAVKEPVEEQVLKTHANLSDRQRLQRVDGESASERRQHWVTSDSRQSDGDVGGIAGATKVGLALELGDDVVGQDVVVERAEQVVRRRGSTCCRVRDVTQPRRVERL